MKVGGGVVDEGTFACRANEEEEEMNKCCKCQWNVLLLSLNVL